MFGKEIARIFHVPYPPLYNSLAEFTDLVEEALSVSINTPHAGEKSHHLPQFRKELSEYGRDDHSTYLWYHSQRQTEFLLDHNPTQFLGAPRLHDAPCSFIGRQENFTRDFSSVLDILQAPNVLAAFGNEYDRKDPRHYSHYYDDSTRRRVERLYANDPEVLGYEFEQGGTISIPPPLYNLQELRAGCRKKPVLSMRFIYWRTRRLYGLVGNWCRQKRRKAQQQPEGPG